VYHLAHCKMLHFWLECIIKAFWDSAFFTGTNKTGILYALAVTALSLGWSARRQVKRHDSWKAAIINWKEVFGTGAIIALAAWVLVFLGHLIAAPYGLHTEIEAQKKQSSQESDRHTQELSSTFASERKRLADDSRVWQAKATETKNECAIKEGISQTLQKQNRDQQATINGCLSQAMKLLAPEEFKMTPVFFDEDYSNAVIRKARWILITNKLVTPVRMLIQCDKYLESAYSGPVSGASMGSGGNRLAPNVWSSEIQSPAWTPTLPFLATVSYRGGGDIVCSFTPR
jgi:hypothetical protein